MKFMEKPIVVDAEPYVNGMEDGFSCTLFFNECKYKDENGKYFNCEKCTLDIKKTPYISSKCGNHNIKNGDWIITDEEGVRFPCRRRIFEREYVPVRDNMEVTDRFDAQLNKNIKIIELTPENIDEALDDMDFSSFDSEFREFLKKRGISDVYMPRDREHLKEMIGEIDETI